MKNRLALVLVSTLLLIACLGVGTIAMATQTAPSPRPTPTQDPKYNEPPWMQELRAQWERSASAYPFPADYWYANPNATSFPHGLYGTPRYYVQPWGWSWSQAPQPAATARPTAVPYGRGSFGEITYSTEYLYQVWICGRSIDFRVHGDGAKTVFRISFDLAETSGARMVLTSTRTHSELKPVCTDAALDFLEENAISEVMIVSRTGEKQIYPISTLREMTIG